MKTYMTPIQVYALWREDGEIVPMAFCLCEGDDMIKVAIMALQGCEDERVAGSRMRNFFCRAVLHGQERNIYLRYDFYRGRWFLYKF